MCLCISVRVRAHVRSASSEFASTANEHGLTVNVLKTMALIIVGRLTPSDTLPLQVGIGAIEVVYGFTYHGVV